jgi:hypothetical protein
MRPVNEVTSSTESCKLPLVSTDLTRSPPMEWATQTIGLEPRPASFSFFKSSLLRYSRLLLQTGQKKVQDNRELYLTLSTLNFTYLRTDSNVITCCYSVFSRLIFTVKWDQLITATFSNYLIFRGFAVTHFRHTTLGRTPLDEWPARRRDLYLTTHNTHKTDIHAPGRIRTHNPSKRLFFYIPKIPYLKQKQ